MTSTPETNECVKENRHIRFLQEDHYVGTDKYTYENPIVFLCQKLERQRDEAISDLEFRRDLYKLQTTRLEELERQRDEAVSSCHIWQKGHAELVAERDYLISLLEGQQFFADTKSTKPERKHIGRWGHNKKEFTSPYINQ